MSLCQSATEVATYALNSQIQENSGHKVIPAATAAVSSTLVPLGIQRRHRKVFAAMISMFVAAAVMSTKPRQQGEGPNVYCSSTKKILRRHCKIICATATRYSPPLPQNALLAHTMCSVQVPQGYVPRLQVILCCRCIILCFCKARSFALLSQDLLCSRSKIFSTTAA